MLAGPFALMDGIGLDTMLSVTEYLAEANNDKYLRKHASVHPRLRRRASW